MFNTRSWSLMFNTFFVDVRSAQSMKHLLFVPSWTHRTVDVMAVFPDQLRFSSWLLAMVFFISHFSSWCYGDLPRPARVSSCFSSKFRTENSDWLIEILRFVRLKAIRQQNADTPSHFHVSTAGDGKFFILFQVDYYLWSSSEFVITSWVCTSGRTFKLFLSVFLTHF